MPELSRALVPLTGRADQFDSVLDRIGGASIAALGEATHGSHEFYTARAEITRRLVEVHGFGAIVLEADWPDVVRVDRYVRGEGEDATPEDALGDFVRFPRWMWGNSEMVDFVAWLRAYDAEQPPERRVGVYGMDLYSLHASIRAVLAYLDCVDPDAAARARERYACFERFGWDPQLYGRVTGLGLSPSCEEQAVDQVLDMLQKAERHVRDGGLRAMDAELVAQQNALVVRNAEHYYRAMFAGHVNTWNMRDHHMVETIERLRDHLRASGRPDKVVVWAHNSHVGDARVTEPGRFGQQNVGQLLRERHGEGEVALVGLTTYRGRVTAAPRWDGPAEQKRVRPALAGSWEEKLHRTGVPCFSVVTRDAGRSLRGWRLNRAIGVVYLPRSEQVSHYFCADLGAQFDVIVHYDETSALVPLERWSTVEAEPGETYPFGV